jgi:hypothetical protein
MHKHVRRYSVRSEAFAATRFDKIFSVLETSVSFIHLMRLIAREDFIERWYSDNDLYKN